MRDPVRRIVRHFRPSSKARFFGGAQLSARDLNCEAIAGTVACGFDFSLQKFGSVLRNTLSRRMLPIAALIAFIGTSDNLAVARPAIRAQKEHVRFLATSNLYRGTWGSNQDIYLAAFLPSDGW